MCYNIIICHKIRRVSQYAHQLKYMVAVFLLIDKFEFFSEFIIPKFTPIFNVQI